MPGAPGLSLLTNVQDYTVNNSTAMLLVFSSMLVILLDIVYSLEKEIGSVPGPLASCLRHTGRSSCFFSPIAGRQAMAMVALSSPGLAHRATSEGCGMGLNRV
jgi:hypothetical protein